MELTVVGYSALALFLESGTEKQPAADAGVQVSLNEGSHQLRLYQSGPNGLDPVTENCLKDGNSRYIPCASVLVRIAKAAKGLDGKPLEKSKVPESDWKRLGLLQPMPKYTDRVYYSLKCRPTDGEVPLLHAMKNRAIITMRQAVMKAQGRDGAVRNDRSVEQYIRGRLTRTMSSKPLDQNINHISKYSPVHGIKVSVDKAVNLPWSNFTMAHICLNPPSAFYAGTPNMMYDRLVFARFLNPSSTDFSPSWTDGFKHLPFRTYHEHLAVVIHLQEIGVTVTEDNYKYGLLEQAWTVVPVFTKHYAYTELFQVPLFMGAPTTDVLRQLAREPCTQWLANAVQENQEENLEQRSIHYRSNLCEIQPMRKLLAN